MNSEKVLDVAFRCGEKHFYYIRLKSKSFYGIIDIEKRKAVLKWVCYMIVSKN